VALGLSPGQCGFSPQTHPQLQPSPLLTKKCGSGFPFRAAGNTVPAYARSTATGVLKIIDPRQLCGASRWTPVKITNPLPDCPSTIAGCSLLNRHTPASRFNSLSDRRPPSPLAFYLSWMSPVFPTTIFLRVLVLYQGMPSGISSEPYYECAFRRWFWGWRQLCFCVAQRFTALISPLFLFEGFSSRDPAFCIK